MATLRDIRRRIGSVRNTEQITKAMKMVSAAKLNRAQTAVRSAEPYSALLRTMVSFLSRGLSEEHHPLFQRREGGKTVVLLFTSDRGLCGGFNANLNKRLHERLRTRAAFPDAELVVFGRTGNDFFRRRGIPIRKAIVHRREAEKPGLIAEALVELVERFMAGEIGRVVLAYNHYENPIRQVPRFAQLIPIVPPEETAPQGLPDEREPLFEPSQADVLGSLLPRYLENQGLIAHLNTEAGEHGARMVAMEGATKNAGEVISKLTLQYNRARQAAITKELIEIVSGAQSV
ncbi:MAG: ATP synthase F1 subunit gamma [Candidatus Lambdaproteobacteria bacterium]|nr:ATP synthase F1 subunit gamma [Candidatus Lambdaproteobacteria bacterium]